MEGDISKIQFRVPGFEEEAQKLCFTERQASAILEMRLYKLIGLEILALEKEHRETLRKIKEYEKLLSSREAMDQVIKADLASIKEEFSSPRRTGIEDGREAVYDESAIEVREVVFVMDRFGYSRVLERATYDRNQETVDSEYSHVVCCLNTDKICLFTDTGALHQVKIADVPLGKLRDKGTPIDNLCKYDGTKEEIVFLTTAASLPGHSFLFATKGALLKQVPGEEFETNNRMVAAAKLTEGDQLVSVQPMDGAREIVIQTDHGVFLRFSAEEIPLQKKNAKGVRGIRLSKGEQLKKVYLLGENTENIAVYKEKQVHLNRLKVSRRDGTGSKVRLN